MLAALLVTIITAPIQSVGGNIAPALLPMPTRIEFSAARMRLDSTLTVSLASYRDARLERAITRAMTRLEGRTALRMPRTYPRGSAGQLVIDVAAAGFATPDLDEDESYTLDVQSSRVMLRAATVVGAMRGIETLLQLQQSDRDGFYLAGAHIEDTPRFRWRGLSLDVSRHFEPVAVIERTIDGMAAVKLNVLHWHLSDDQGFRIESRRYPRLHAAGSDSLYYTQAQVREVVRYAADRGIRVVPEFDVPGHTTAWFPGYPTLGSKPGPYQVDRKWGVSPGVMDPTRPATYTFLDNFIAEISTLFPDRYWHIGGDEVDPKQWNESRPIQRWMKLHRIADAHALQTYFNKRLFAILAKHRRQPVGWDEILQPDLPKTAVIQSWRGTAALVTAAKQGRRAILSAPYYLDHIRTAGQLYLDDPLPSGSELTAAEQRLILGGEACMWSEYVTEQTIESRIWPRLGAVAERLWSPATLRDVDDMYRRLEVTSVRLEELGLRHEEHTARMVRRFAGSDTTVFNTLLSYARPKGFGNYGTDQLSPHSRLLDAARPDPWNGWRMRAAAQHAIAGDTAAVRQLRADFVRMQSLPGALQDAQSRVPLAQEGLRVADVLRELGGVGIRALDALIAPPSSSAAWRPSVDSLLQRLQRDPAFGLLRPVGADAVRVLVERRPTIDDRR